MDLEDLLKAQCFAWQRNLSLFGKSCPSFWILLDLGLKLGTGQGLHMLQVMQGSLSGFSRSG